MILAIDPGTTESAYCILKNDGKVVSFGKLGNNTLLCDIRMNRDMFDDATRVCVEMVASYGMPVGREVFETVVWIGRFMQAVDHFGWIAAQRVYRKDVKMCLCGQTAKVNDAVIRQALIDMYGGKELAIGNKKNPGPCYGMKADMWAALAVGVTFLRSGGF